MGEEEAAQIVLKSSLWLPVELFAVVDGTVE